MNRGHVAVAASMLVLGTAVLVTGVIAAAAGDLAMVGLVAFGFLLAVLGAALLRDAARAAGQRHRPERDAAGGYHPTAPAGEHDGGGDFGGDLS
ncbi:hypothetical protein [Micromonospora sp. NPDC050276]|uniref:hypothetical protein n=1 Tax=Micromonospora sp. NPDC050276 TaxID=3364278 RepID=UPI0037BE1824